ncbi:MAG TPA: membrane protein insertion efficiency factor YidD [Candidatus Azosocius sp. HAIN]
MHYIIIKFLIFYKIFLSSILPHKCRFYPSCSSYLLLSVKKFTFYKAFYFFFKRIIKCNCFFSGGYDPVP